jgi:glucose/arabinose dehydrogenase
MPLVLLFMIAFGQSLAALVASPALAMAAAPPTPPPGFEVSDFVTGLEAVTDFAFLPDGRVVITEKAGAVKVRRKDGKVVNAARFAVDDSSEKGMLGVAVDPDFLRTKRIFLYYSAADSAGGTDLDRHRVVSLLVKDGDTLDRASEKILARGLRGPANHDGGGLAIGTDGKLYIGVGDTGCNSGLSPHRPYRPTNYFGTCLSNANGKILRVNLDGSIPKDNPLVGVRAVTACGDTCRDPVEKGKTAAPREDIWAWGLRNPWRFWFDPRTSKLWVGDVGEVTYEEITIVEKGRHHGWPWREGPRGWPDTRCAETVPNTGRCVDPVYSCSPGRGGGGVDGGCRSITGGLIVDSCHWPESDRGRYVFGDNFTGSLWTLKVNAARTGVERGSRRDFIRLRDGIPVSLHLGPDGNLYVASFPGDAGKILRIAPTKPVPCKP